MVLAAAALGQALSAGADSGNLKSLWRVRSAQEFQSALKDGIGFSFTYAGEEWGPAPPAGWEVATLAGDTETKFRHSSGLTVTRQARAFPEFDAIEYTLRLENEGASELPVLEAVNALDLGFRGDCVKGAALVSCGGGGADAAFPPKDFAMTRTPLGPSSSSANPMALAGDGGKPSATSLPFFFVENERRSAGMYIGIGWSGQWKATLRAGDGGDTLRMRAGMPDMRLKLAPGEQISGPAILVGCFRGGVPNGANVLRRLVRDRYAPGVNAQRLVAPVVYTTWFDIGAELDEKLFKTLADDAAALGVEIFLLDAGWYHGTPMVPYSDMRTTWDAISSSLGNWEAGEDRARFPSGLRSLAEYVRSRGMQFGLWFEPERAGPQSVLARKHPDWVTFVPDRKWGQVNLGRTETQEYFGAILERAVTDLGVRYIRWDQNTHDLLSYWAAGDGPDRRGLSQIRHIEGLHRIEDRVVRQHPEVILESCAGGGQRIDLATLRRRHTIWISDQTMDPHIVRFHLEGLNHFIPGSAQGVAFAPPVSAYRGPGASFPDLAFQSCFGGAFGLAGRLHEWPQAVKSQARKHVAAFKEIRKYLDEDYYLLVPQPRTLETWGGWQFHDARKGEGFVQAFRLRSSEQTQRLALRGLDLAAEYEFTDLYTRDAFSAGGATLMTEGLRFDLPPLSSRVLVYHRQPQRPPEQRN